MRIKLLYINELVCVSYELIQEVDPFPQSDFFPHLHILSPRLLVLLQSFLFLLLVVHMSSSLWQRDWNWLQLSTPHTRPGAHAESLSQSPCPLVHFTRRLPLEQQFLALWLCLFLPLFWLPMQWGLPCLTESWNVKQVGLAVGCSSVVFALCWLQKRKDKGTFNIPIKMTRNNPMVRWPIVVCEADL